MQTTETNKKSHSNKQHQSPPYNEENHQQKRQQKSSPNTPIEMTIILCITVYIVLCGLKQMYLWIEEQVSNIDMYGWWYGIKAETNGTFLLPLPNNVFLYFFIFVMIRYSIVRKKVFHGLHYLLFKVSNQIYTSVLHE